MKDHTVESPSLSQERIKVYMLNNRKVYVYPNCGWDTFTGGGAECVGLIQIDRPKPYGKVYSYWDNSFKWGGDNGHWRTKKFDNHIRADGQLGKAGTETGGRMNALDYFKKDLLQIRSENKDVKVYASKLVSEHEYMTIEKFYERVLGLEFGA